LVPLTKDWYDELEKQANSNFINLPIEFQVRGYDYEFIAKRYLTFFRSTENTRQEKLLLAKKFLKFIRSVNKNRAKHELGEEFFMCFGFFMDNFSDILSKQDFISLEGLSVLTDGIDKSQFIDDILSVEDLQRRIKNLKKTKEREEVIDAEWTEFEAEYISTNPERIQQKISSKTERTLKICERPM